MGFMCNSQDENEITFNRLRGNEILCVEIKLVQKMCVKHCLI